MNFQLPIYGFHNIFFPRLFSMHLREFKDAKTLRIARMCELSLDGYIYVDKWNKQ